MSCSSKAAAEAESKRIRKRKRGTGDAGRCRAHKSVAEQPHHDDGDDVETVAVGSAAEKPASASSKQRKTRLNKLCKPGPGAVKEAPINAKDSACKAAGATTAKKRVQDPVRKGMKVQKATEIMATLKTYDLPGLLCPDELKNQCLSLHRTRDSSDKCNICMIMSCVSFLYGYDLKNINISIRSFTVYPEGGKKSCRGKNPNAAVAQSPIGVILLSESFYVKQVLQKVDGSAIAMDGKGGATVPWHHFDAGVAAACLGSSFTCTSCRETAQICVCI